MNYLAGVPRGTNEDYFTAFFVVRSNDFGTVWMCVNKKINKILQKWHLCKTLTCKNRTENCVKMYTQIPTTHKSIKILIAVQARMREQDRRMGEKNKPWSISVMFLFLAGSPAAAEQQMMAVHFSSTFFNAHFFKYKCVLKWRAFKYWMTNRSQEFTQGWWVSQANPSHCLLPFSSRHNQPFNVPVLLSDVVSSPCQMVGGWFDACILMLVAGPQDLVTAWIHLFLFCKPP